VRNSWGVRHMKILVTGGAGYVGSIMVPELLKEGHEVIVIDNFMYNQQSLLDVCHDSNLTIVRGDARDWSAMVKHIGDADVIFPLAAITGAPACAKDEVAARTTIVGAIETLLKLRQKHQKIIYPTTNSGYGIGQQGIFCTEETPLRPISLYGRLKAEAENIILTSGNSIALRLATAFGASPRMRMDLLVNDFTHKAMVERNLLLFEAHFKRNFIHVRDIARAFVHCLNNFDGMKDQVYNVGLSDANLSKLELCEVIKKYMPDFWFAEYTNEWSKNALGEWPKDIDQRNYIVSNEKIEKMGFKPKFSLDDGIKELMRVFSIIRRNQFSNV